MDNELSEFRYENFSINEEFFETLKYKIHDQGIDFIIENTIADYVINVENKTIKCHKNILNKIDYFNKLFSNKWTDDNETIFEDFKYNIVLDVLKYAYCEMYELNKNNIFEYIELADFLCYTKFKNALIYIKIRYENYFYKIKHV